MTAAIIPAATPRSTTGAWMGEELVFRESQTQDTAQAFQLICASRTPDEFLAAQQAWLMARFGAYAELGQGLAKDICPGLEEATDLATFRLPD